MPETRRQKMGNATGEWLAGKRFAEVKMGESFACCFGGW